MPDDDIAARVIGVWQLVSIERYKVDTFLRHPLGEAPGGRIFYAANGYMNAFLMRSALDGIAQAEMLDHILCYSGRWSVADGRIHHDVDLSTNPDYAGTRLSRGVRWLGDDEVMLYSGDPAGTHNRLLWRRLGAG